MFIHSGERTSSLRALSMISASGNQCGCALLFVQGSRANIPLPPAQVDDDDGEHCRLSLLADFDGLVVCDEECGISFCEQSINERMLKSVLRLDFFNGGSIFSD